MKKKMLLFSLLFVLGKSNLIACKCLDPVTIEKAYENSSLVLHGKVISLNFVSLWISLEEDKAEIGKEKFKLQFPNQYAYETEILLKVEIEIIKQYKGENKKDTITLFTARKSASCGFTRFEVGKEFIVYAQPESYIYNWLFSCLAGLEKKETYWTNHCSRTTEFYNEEAAELERISQ